MLSRKTDSAATKESYRWVGKIQFYYGRLLFFQWEKFLDIKGAGPWSQWRLKKRVMCGERRSGEPFVTSGKGNCA